MTLSDLQERYVGRCPAIGLVGRTPLVKVNLFADELPKVEVYAKVEAFNPGGSLKDRPVAYMLLDALDKGLLDGKTVLDSSSGNAGIAYAWIGGALGVDVKLVIPDNASNERKKRILAHGATIHFTKAQDGYDEALREVWRWLAPQYDFSARYGCRQLEALAKAYRLSPFVATAAHVRAAYVQACCTLTLIYQYTNILIY